MAMNAITNTQLTDIRDAIEDVVTANMNASPDTLVAIQMQLTERIKRIMLGQQERQGTTTAIREGVQKREALRMRIKELLHINIMDTKMHNKMIQDIMNWESQGEKLETFAAWWDTFWKGKQRQPPSPMDIYTYWPRAFTELHYIEMTLDEHVRRSVEMAQTMSPR